jgi:hypothetical protein
MTKVRKQPKIPVLSADAEFPADAGAKMLGVGGDGDQCRWPLDKQRE